MSADLADSEQGGKKNLIDCPVCGISLPLSLINTHLDSDCQIVESRESVSSTEPDEVLDRSKSFFTPTQSRKSAVKKEVLETPVFSSQKTSKKRKAAEYEGEESKSDPDTSHPAKSATTRSVARGKEAFHQAAPLADRVRPRSLDDFIGQEDLVGPSGLLRGLIDAGRIPSMILWGPSGTGKTTLARIIAKSTTDEYLFKELSATNNNVADCKKVFEDASNLLSLTGKRTLVFLDEIHRFTKSQQDIFLPYVESGKITLIGATTENPSFRINNALISRCRVFVLASLSTPNVLAILEQALHRIQDSTMPHDILEYLAGLCDGDARVGLNLLDMVLSLPRASLTIDLVRQSLKRTTIAYDMKGDEHYDTISALHKSIRGSDVNASLYC